MWSLSSVVIKFTKWKPPYSDWNLIIDLGDWSILLFSMGESWIWEYSINIGIKPNGNHVTLATADSKAHVMTPDCLQDCMFFVWLPNTLKLDNVACKIKSLLIFFKRKKYFNYCLLFEICLWFTSKLKGIIAQVFQYFYSK